jgi:hypothetical protein
LHAVGVFGEEGGQVLYHGFWCDVVNGCKGSFFF